MIKGQCPRCGAVLMYPGSCGCDASAPTLAQSMIEAGIDGELAALTDRLGNLKRATPPHMFTAGLIAALRALLERGPTGRMKKACGVYEAVAAARAAGGGGE